MQFHPFGEMRNQLVPDADHEVLDRTHLAGHKIHIEVQVLVIEFFDDVFVDDGAEFLHIVHETGIRVGITLDRNVQLKIVPMPVLVGAAPENGIVLLLRPPRVIQLVGRVKMFCTCYVNHLVVKISAKVAAKS